jgi:hypothetical protein
MTEKSARIRMGVKTSGMSIDTYQETPEKKERKMQIAGNKKESSVASSIKIEHVLRMSQARIAACASTTKKREKPREKNAMNRPYASGLSTGVTTSYPETR